MPINPRKPTSAKKMVKKANKNAKKSGVVKNANKEKTRTGGGSVKKIGKPKKTSVVAPKKTPRAKYNPSSMGLGSTKKKDSTKEMTKKDYKSEFGRKKLKAAKKAGRVTKKVTKPVYKTTKGKRKMKGNQ